MTPLTPDVEGLLRRAAELRAAGSSWTSAARQIEADELELRDLARLHHAAFRTLLKAARREVTDEAAAEALFCLRRLLRSEDDKTSSRAAEAILKFKMTLVRHRKAGKPVALPDPRLEGMNDEDIEFARYLFTLPEEQLAAWADLRGTPWPEYPTPGPSPGGGGGQTPPSLPGKGDGG